MCKLIIPVIPMGGDYLVKTSPKERKLITQVTMNDIQETKYKFLAENLEKQNDDPYIYPMKMTNEILGKLPPTLLITTEFDFYLNDTKKFAKRLRKNDKLLDLIIIPKATHVFQFLPKLNDKWENLMKTVIESQLK